MMQLIWPGAMAAQAIYVAAKLGIADLLNQGPRTIDELAGRTKTHAPSLHRMLRALTSLGVFSETGPGKFQNTVLSETLRNNLPGSVRAWPIFLGAPFNWKLWGSLEETVRTGEAASERVYGKPFWSHLAENPDDAAVFNAAMSSRSEMLGAAVVAAFDFSRFRKIVDVGGGHGRLLHSILSTAPSLQGILYDLPEVVANATFVAPDVAEGRAEIVGGSFLESVPSGADSYILSGVIHDWSDADALRLLKNCRQAIAKDGRLLLATAIAKDATSQADSRNFMDVYMMLYGGRERSESDLRALLQTAGFSVLRIVPTATPTCIVESEPI
jgi:hypothetical protein